ncbi:MAG UNVERIFIED_CONTAM: class I SAM-dependent methyltransferase [Anaerolineae bacterium]|jgi:ubiquinone/menaquinone biosynthesis C-methylase UbiE
MIWEVIALSIVGFALLGVLVWWLFVETEGVYLGQGIVTWLYDVYATRYDSIKEYREDYEHWFLAIPIMDRIEPKRPITVLDLGTGTGRLPLALLQHRDFEGRIIGLDLSKEMLKQAQTKLAGVPNVTFIHHPAEQLPFEDATFDLVTALEMIEFTSNPTQLLREAHRVLLPSGLLLVTWRKNVFMPGKVNSREHFANLLVGVGFERITFEAWQVDYEQVWAVKPSVQQGYRI